MRSMTRRFIEMFVVAILLTQLVFGQGTPSSEDLRKAKDASIRTLPGPTSGPDNACPANSPFTIKVDWAQAGSISPSKLSRSGDYCIEVDGVNNLLFGYGVGATTTSGTIDDLSNLLPFIPGAIASTGKTKIGADAVQASSTNSSTCHIHELLPALHDPASSVASLLLQFQPQKPAKGKYPSVSLDDSLSTWGQVKPAYDEYVAALKALQAELANSDCTSDTSLLADAVKAINSYPPMRDALEGVARRIGRSHTAILRQTLDCISGYDVTVKEQYSGLDTEASPKTYHLESGCDVLTLSGGFLLTQIQARSYSIRNVTPVPPATTSTVLVVDGLSSIRPTLLALMNYHLPSRWLDSNKIGVALSAGPVIDVSSGKTDTSRLGFFGGVSMHLWSRLYITPGVHVGEFADFPTGFTAAGQPYSNSLGSPVPNKRYTARFGIAITFQTKSLSSLLGGGGTKSVSGSTTTSSGK